MVYTVDEVSVDLGIPRPTVYRYLKEYSIPFSRRSGRIFVPQESVGKIRMVRELHDGGYGTEAVRVRLRQGEGNELARVTERLDELTRVLEQSRVEARRPVEPAHAPDAHAVRMILARQSLMMSAISNLAEMMGDLMAANGLQRRPILDYPEPGPGPARLPDRRPASLVVTNRGATTVSPTRRTNALPPNISHDKFGTLARRRRAALVTLLILAALAAPIIWQTL